MPNVLDPSNNDRPPAFGSVSAELRRPPVRRVLSFLAGDLVGSRETLASLGEARVEAAHAAYLALVRGAIRAGGGRELVGRGETVIAAFESPSDAVSSAVAVQRALDRRNRRASDRLDARIGIHVGEAIENDVRPDRGDYPTPVTEALALCDSALGGQILVSDLVASLAVSSGSCSFQRIGLVELKGLPEPVSAFEVVYECDPDERLPLPPELATRPAGRSPFVGRNDERARLRMAFTKAVDGQGPLVLVGGEPGIGKTRLVAEFALDVHATGGVVLWGRSFEEALIAYQPFAEALRHFVVHCPPHELSAMLPTGAWPLVRLLPDLADRLPGHIVESHEESEGDRHRLFEGISTILAEIALDTPVLLVLDDLQWADKATLLLLKYVALDHRPTSLLILGTFRDSEVPPSHPLSRLLVDVEKDRPVERIELDGLPEADVADLLDALIGWSPPVDVTRSLRVETDGNPFFLEEVVHLLGEHGITADRARLASRTPSVRDFGVPRRVRDLIVQRLQRLSPSAREVLGVAAVIGTEFGLPELGTVLSMADDELVRLMDEAVKARLIGEAAGGVALYRFGHALIQQTLYEEHSANRRASLHARIAEAIEGIRPDDAASIAELARHFARAGKRYGTKVVHYGSLAGNRALAKLAYEDAILEFDRALQGLSAVRPIDEVARADLLVRLGIAETRVGDAPAARASFREAAELSMHAGSSETLARAALGYGGTAGFGGVWETFARVDTVLVGLLRAALDRCRDGDTPTRVHLLGRLAQALYWSSDKGLALMLSQEALDAARRLEDPAAIAYALDSRHVALWGPDHVDEVRRLAEEMLRLGEALGDRDIQLEAYAWLITDALQTDPIDVVDGYIAAHARVAAELRQPYHLWYTEATRAMRAHVNGQFDEMARLAEKAWVHGEQAHGENALQTHLVQTVLLRIEQGRLDDLIDGLAAYASESPLPAWRAALALAYATLDRRDEALAQLAYFADDGLTGVSRDCIWLATFGFLAQVAARIGAAEHARQMYDLLLPYADHNCPVGGAVLCLGPVSWLLGMLATASGQHERAVGHLDHALSRSRALGSPPFTARAQFAMARALAERNAEGDHERALGLLDDAGRVAAELGMTRLVADVEQLGAADRLRGPKVPAGR